MAKPLRNGREGKTDRISISLEPSLRIEFQTACDNNDIKVSAAVRRLMIEFVKKDQEANQDFKDEVGVSI